MARFKYETCCIAADGDDIQAMLDTAQEVSYRTFRKHCEGVDAWAQDKGYGLRAPDLTLARDWAVSFAKGRFQGRPCYFLTWSAIEYIWTAEGAGEDFGYYSANRV